jgi:hypothetical protein
MGHIITEESQIPVFTKALVTTLLDDPAHYR